MRIPIQLFTSMRIRIPIQHFTSIWIWIPIQLFTLMRIRILLLVKVMRICHHWPTEPLYWASTAPFWASTALHGSILSLECSWIFTWIRIQFLITMRTHADSDTKPWRSSTNLGNIPVLRVILYTRQTQNFIIAPLWEAEGHIKYETYALLVSLLDSNWYWYLNTRFKDDVYERSWQQHVPQSRFLCYLPLFSKASVLINEARNRKIGYSIQKNHYWFLLKTKNYGRTQL